MIIHINGYPGVGKLTVARLLADRLGAKLLDNHSIYDIALSLTEFKPDAYYETLRATRSIAYERILELPKSVPVILTNAHASDSAWGNECWDAVIDLARKRKTQLYVVVMECSATENARRIQDPERDEKRKPRDANMFKGNIDGPPLLDRGGDELMRFDSTNLSPRDSAQLIGRWIESRSRRFRVTT